MIEFIKSLLSKILPNSTRKKINSFIFNQKLKRVELSHVKALEKARTKEKLRVVFFATHAGVWKYDQLYKHFVEHPKFEPLVLVCPVVNFGRENMLIEMESCYKLLIGKKYNVLRAYDIRSNAFVDVKKTVNPDIIFYTNPHRGVIDEKYFITQFPDILTCYVPYSSMIINSVAQFNKFLCNLLWKSFVDNSYSLEMSKKLMPNKGKNVFVSGFPSLDVLIDQSYQPKNVWRHNQIIKIIWAPHHTIEGNESINFSSFFEFENVMIKLAEKYSNEIQLAFKPHPLLYVKLCKIWGKEKTEEYYYRWETMPNTQLENGDYIDLFLTSDAMVFDSCSFINEYIYTQKPSIFITNDIVKSQLNDYGLDAFECHQQAFSESDIVDFFESILKNKPDPKANQKKLYYEKYITMFEEKSASERIVSEICKSIYGTN